MRRKRWLGALGKTRPGCSNQACVDEDITRLSLVFYDAEADTKWLHYGIVFTIDERLVKEKKSVRHNNTEQ